MSISLLLEMAADTDPDRTALVSDELRLSTAELSALADGGAGVIAASGAQHVAYVGTGGAMLPLLLFASARAAIPVTPLNYRLSAEGLRALLDRLPDPLVVVDDEYRDAVGDGYRTIGSAQFLTTARDEQPGPDIPVFADPDSVGVVLFTSGTTSKPKAVELSHTNLTSYIMGTVEFASAEPDDAALICVPPYHIAGVSAALSNLYAGRKMVYLRHFDAQKWVQLVSDEGVTSATVVPTMLDRIVSVLEATNTALPTLRTLAYGGSKVPLPLVRKALSLLPDVGFVNAYGLTETSSTIAVLTPDDHRAALAASDDAALRRLGSVGQPVPGVEVQVRGEDGTVLGPGEPGELFVRGEQVSGKYTDIGSVLDEQGWFPTKDVAYLDEQGYLFIGGRSDDTIIRGGENIAPAEIEDVLVEHPHVRDCAVVGADDPQWGQIIVAVVVARQGAEPDPEELRAHVRSQLRGSRTPDRVVFRDELPTNATGKVLRRELVSELNQDRSPAEPAVQQAPAQPA
ncbi:class I adenylate-forming enzyme family protein [Mycolicibacterium parafortuitum]|uniref:Long-chain-fatty-acid--CoA ligase FadD13 n=1 Tax=Mycolicibacterium parafortuitum TaxID=39692 RepID=A0A375YQ30_MYCPF|nr:fatty acid--CoA ligase family protein [Mycolicibacterium parafortuitum]ORB28268.1 AMP-dependent synthetase [Mycolicibacterium parafortuitum]SRX83265.1 o-succinylbenzoate--CoA ligase [Pseudonocardia dioxanivorans] [Mycolicibacterium parafortuitum]